MDPVQIGIGVFVVCIVLVLGWILYKRSTAPSPSPTPTPTSEEDVVLQPIISAEVKAVKTGDDQTKVSGYSFDRTEYDAGNCTFLPSMSKYVSMAVNLTVGNDTKLPALAKVKAVWRVGSTSTWSEAIVDVSNRDSWTVGDRIEITIPPKTTDSTTNIACATPVTDRTDNSILIYYSTKSAAEIFRPGAWATINLTSGLGTAITTAFGTIATGTGTPLTVTLTATDDVQRFTEKNIPYRLITKSGAIITYISLNKYKYGDIDGYVLQYRKPDPWIELVVQTRTRARPISGTDPYDGFVAFEVITGAFINKFIYFDGVDKTLSYADPPPNDAMFFKLEIDSQDCQYTWTPATPAACSTTCGPGYKMEKATLPTIQPAKGGKACVPVASVPPRPGTATCNPQPTPCTAACVLGEKGTIYEDILGTNTATCVAAGTKSQMKIVSQPYPTSRPSGVPSATPWTCKDVYNAPATDKVPVTITGVPAIAAVCPVTIRSYVTCLSSSIDYLTGGSTGASSATLPTGAINGASRIVVSNIHSATSGNRNITLSLYDKSTNPIYSFHNGSGVALGPSHVAKVVLTNTGQFKLMVSQNISPRSWFDSINGVMVASTFGTPFPTTVGGTARNYTARIVDYTQPAGYGGSLIAVTITKLEIAYGTTSGAGGTIVATYPPW